MSFSKPPFGTYIETLVLFNICFAVLGKKKYMLNKLLSDFKRIINNHSNDL